MKKVVITGLGAVTPIGNNVRTFTENLYAGQSGAAPVSRFDASFLPVRFAAEVKGLSSEFSDVKITYALVAAEEAMREAFGADLPRVKKTESALSIGVGLELFSMENLIEYRKQKANANVEEMPWLNTPSDLCAHLLGQEYGFNQPPLVTISACAAGTDAIGLAFRAIQCGRLGLVLAGGTDSMINPMGFAGFSKLGALSTRNDSPAAASRPFDETRDGFVMGEGAAFLVLEAEDLARARGATILARVSGYGNSLDAYSISDPHPEGAGALLAMRRALQSASLEASEISAVSAHGTSTAKNDPAEAAAIRTLLGEGARAVPVMATKSMIGHLISAAGAVESVASVQALLRQELHATLNLKKPSADCQLHHVFEKPIKTTVKHILKNSFGFGGQNACLVLSHRDCAGF